MFVSAPRFAARLAPGAAPRASNDPSAPRLRLRLPAAGLVAGTLVETAAGWQPVETLAIGQAVHTWDGGLQPLVRLERRRIAPGASLVAVPGGVLSTCSEMLLLPGQHILVETGAAAARLDRDMVLVPAAALDGYQGAARRSLRAGIDVIVPAFETEEVVFANTGALVHCAGADRPSAPTQSTFFTALDADAARALLGLAPALPPAPEAAVA